MMALIDPSREEQDDLRYTRNFFSRCNSESNREIKSLQSQSQEFHFLCDTHVESLSRKNSLLSFSPVSNDHKSRYRRNCCSSLSQVAFSLSERTTYVISSVIRLAVWVAPTPQKVTSLDTGFSFFPMHFWAEEQKTRRYLFLFLPWVKKNRSHFRRGVLLLLWNRNLCIPRLWKVASHCLGTSVKNLSGHQRSTSTYG